MKELYIGLMSGTSLDGVDAVLVDLSGDLKVLAHHNTPFNDDLKKSLLALNTKGDNELHTAYLCANALVRIYADACFALLERCSLSASDITAIGAHGQTVRHLPGAFDGTGYTVQINNAALLVELTGIQVCADFRSRDVAAGGQGAPLVPAFHQRIFQHATRVRGVLNLGGISNLSVLPPACDDHSAVIGFDCGPANCLMDAWCLAHTGKPFDDAGAWADSGVVISELLALFLTEPYFHPPPPKSTGRDLFNTGWLEDKLNTYQQLSPQTEQSKNSTRAKKANDSVDSRTSVHRTLHPADVQATLAALTVHACADAVARFAPTCTDLLICGGGALNDHLMRALQRALPAVTVAPSSAYGLPPLQVEACAFAWLAQQCLLGEPASLHSVTGARGNRVLGAIYKV